MRGNTFNPHVHGARGLFSAMVFVYHVYNSGLPTLPFVAGSLFERVALDSMKFGVELFFGISGLVILGALERARSPLAFIWDRIARILPTLWMALLAITLMYLAAGRALPSLGLWLANFAAPPPFFDILLLHPAAWSLGYEFTFYWLCAMTMVMRRAGVSNWLWLSCTLGALLILFYPRAILIAAGVMIAAELPRPRWVDGLARHPIVLLAIFLIAWRVLDMAAGNRIRLMSPLYADLGLWWSLMPFMFLTGIVGGTALLGVERGHGALGRLLRTAPMQWLGTISYSFYLWHPICMAAVKFALVGSGGVAALGIWSQLALFLLALPPSLLVSHWSQRLLEDRATRWLRMLAKPRRHATSSPIVTVPAGGFSREAASGEHG